MREPIPANIRTGAESDPSDPKATLRPGADGIPVVLADGREWLLAHGGIHPSLDEARDRLFDAAIVAGTYDDGDLAWISVAAVKLLRANHDIDHVEAFALVQGAPTEGLVRAVEAALL